MNSYDPVKIFVDWYGEQIKAITGASFGDFHKEHKVAVNFSRILFFCVIDSMSDVIELQQSKENPTKDDKRRFLVALEKYGNWPSHNRVCRPHLEALLKKEKRSAFDNVRKHIDQLAPWPQTSQADVETYDPTYAELAAPGVWPRVANTNALLKFGEGSLESLQHRFLLYDIRSKLVHELRDMHSEITVPPGKTNPFYWKVNDSTGERPIRYWKLFYPKGFLEKLAENILNGLERYCREGGIDPLPRLRRDLKPFENLH